MRKSLFAKLAVLTLCFALALCPALSLAAAPSYLTCAIVATDDLALRPLELNQRDVVSVLDLVYEGLFSMDDALCAGALAEWTPTKEIEVIIPFSPGGGSDLLKLDDALASVDDFVAGKVN